MPPAPTPRASYGQNPVGSRPQTPPSRLRPALVPPRPARGDPCAAGLTCLKQKGMVSTLTPTMLFTMFVISPQLEAAAAVIARGRGPRSPGPRRWDGGCETLRGTGDCLEEAASREGGRHGQPPDPARPCGGLMASSPTRCRWPPPRPRFQTRKSSQGPARATSAGLHDRL